MLLQIEASSDHRSKVLCESLNLAFHRDAALGGQVRFSPFLRWFIGALILAMAAFVLDRTDQYHAVGGWIWSLAAAFALRGVYGWYLVRQREK